MACPQEPNLVPGDPADNKTEIENIVRNGGHARIPKGAWPVDPLLIGSNGRISGCGIGVSALELASATGPVISTSDKAENVTVNDLTIDGEGVQGTSAWGLTLNGCSSSTFYNLEIKNFEIGGVDIRAHVEGSTLYTAPTDCTLYNINISRSGVYGVRMDSCERLVLSGFNVREIGRGEEEGDDPAGSAWPKAAFYVRTIDAGKDTTVTNDLTISDWLINFVGQGIVFKPLPTGKQSQGLLISNINGNDIAGNNMMHVEHVTQLSANNICFRNFDAEHLDSAEDIGGIIFNNVRGTVSNLTVTDVRPSNANYPLQVIGNSNLSLSNVLFKDIARAVMQIGPMGGNPDATSVSISNFRFDNVSTETGPGFIIIQNNSTGDVRFNNGVIRGIVNSFVACNLRESARFENCDFEAPSGIGFVFEKTSPGQAIGKTNNWNEKFEALGFGENVVYVTNLLVDDGVVDIQIKNQAKWDGNEVFLRNQSGATFTVTVESGAINGPTSVNNDNEMLVFRSDGTDWFSNLIGVS